MRSTENPKPQIGNAELLGSDLQKASTMNLELMIIRMISHLGCNSATIISSAFLFDGSTTASQVTLSAAM